MLTPSVASNSAPLQFPSADANIGHATTEGSSSPTSSPADAVSLSAAARNLDGWWPQGPAEEDGPFSTFDDVFNLNGRSVERLFGLEQRADPAILGETLSRIGELLQRGVVGYEVRRLKNGQRYVSFLSVEMAPGGPRGRAYPPGDPRARLDR